MSVSTLRPLRIKFWLRGIMAGTALISLGCNGIKPNTPGPRVAASVDVTAARLSPTPKQTHGSSPTPKSSALPPTPAATISPGATSTPAVVASPSPSPPSVSRAPGTGRTLLAVYLCGTDLEDDVAPRNGVPDEQEHPGEALKGGEGTNDLTNLVLGYKGLSEPEKANVGLLVAFGGARSKGWAGIRYGDETTVTKDAEDGTFGNLNTGYTDIDPAADMGDGKTFEAFLRKTKARAKDYDRTMVVLWDHGGAYTGICFDDNHPETSGLTLPRLKAAFGAAGMHPDILGMDACLMANLEVASALKDNADYLVAAEEEESHGWDYERLVGYLAKSPSAGAPDVGREVVNDFVNFRRDPLVDQVNNLSVIDLHKIAAVASRFDALVGTLEASDQVLPSLYAAYFEARPFGRHGGTDVAVDLVDWAQKLRTYNSASSGPADALINAVQDSVIYSKAHESLAHSNGLSVVSLNTPASQFGEKIYGSQNAVSSAWLTYVQRVIIKALSDKVAPVVANEVDCGDAICFDGTDDVALIGTATTHAIDMGDKGFQVVGSEDARHANGTVTAFQAPKWDGRCFVLHAGGSTTPIPVFSINKANGPKATYSASVLYNGKQAELVIENGPGGVERFGFQAVDTLQSGLAVSNKGEIVFKPGDQVKFGTLTLSADQSRYVSDMTPSIGLDAGATVTYEAIAGKAVFYAEIQDVGGNATFGKIYPAIP